MCEHFMTSRLPSINIKPTHRSHRIIHYFTNHVVCWSKIPARAFARIETKITVVPFICSTHPSWPFVRPLLTEAHSVSFKATKFQRNRNLSLLLFSDQHKISPDSTRTSVTRDVVGRKKSSIWRDSYCSPKLVLRDKNSCMANGKGKPYARMFYFILFYFIIFFFFWLLSIKAGSKKCRMEKLRGKHLSRCDH